MNNKYVVISKEKLYDNIDLYSLLDINSQEDYSCMLEFNMNKVKVLMDDMANKFDVSEALFDEDRELIKILPIDMITYNMEKEYNENSSFKINSLYKTLDDYLVDYKIEEDRVQQLRKNNKQLRKKRGGNNGKN